MSRSGREARVQRLSTSGGERRRPEEGTPREQLWRPQRGVSLEGVT